MSDGRDVIYCYDGTFEGLMCCVFESYTKREIPSGIISGEPEQLFFGTFKTIKTVHENAVRVINSIPAKISADAFELIRKAFLTCHPDKDMLILQFMYKGYKYGASVMQHLTDDTVDKLLKAVQHCDREAHLLLGFTRFTDGGGALAAVIEPKNRVIPIIANHFVDRYRNENFLIYDKTHRMALIYCNYKAEIAENIDFTLPDANDTELFYRSLWQAFYDTIGIKERFNPRCRMTLMPKRYWGNMTEMQRELNAEKGSRLEAATQNPMLAEL